MANKQRTDPRPHVMRPVKNDALPCNPIEIWRFAYLVAITRQGVRRLVISDNQQDIRTLVRRSRIADHGGPSRDHYCGRPSSTTKRSVHDSATHFLCIGRCVRVTCLPIVTYRPWNFMDKATMGTQREASARTRSTDHPQDAAMMNKPLVVQLGIACSILAIFPAAAAAQSSSLQDISRAVEPSGDTTIFLAREIITLDPRNASPEAVAVKQGRDRRCWECAITEATIH